jgi:hypothetical protein
LKGDELEEGLEEDIKKEDGTVTEGVGEGATATATVESKRGRKGKKGRKGDKRKGRKPKALVKEEQTDEIQKIDENTPVVEEEKEGQE